MPAPDLFDLMEQYALRGLDDWRNNTGEDLQRRARECLGMAIADTDWEVRMLIRNACNGGAIGQQKFIPMPNHRHEGIERCFFLPIREHGDENIKMAFDLFLLVDEENCLAFRFEPADPPEQSHNYGHVQLSRRLLRRTIEPSGIPSWLPDSYPAFPVPSSDPLKMFLSMATAVHGYAGGIESVLQDLFQKASRPGDAAPYVGVLQEMLN